MHAVSDLRKIKQCVCGINRVQMLLMQKEYLVNDMYGRTVRGLVCRHRGAFHLGIAKRGPRMCLYLESVPDAVLGLVQVPDLVNCCRYRYYVYYR